ncbi:MAG: GNAT family N-acetyltransferase [Thermoplasmata archaeon]
MRCIAESVPSPNQLRADPTLAAARPTLRPFDPSDVPRVTEIVSEALREHYEPSLYLSLSRQWPEGFLIAADPRGTLIGFLLGVVQVDREGRILMFAVEREHRTRGVGALLMTAFLDRCRERGLTRSTLEVRVSNATALRFYTRFRYSVVDLLRGYYSDGENGYQMARDLP